MEPVQESEHLVLPDLGSFTRPVLRVFDEVADRQPDAAFDRGEDADHAAPPADLHVQPPRPALGVCSGSASTHPRRLRGCS
jgi:hypothetical protein